MPSDLSRIEASEENSLLIEAVSLLVQRQRESEGWIAEQLWRAEERATAAERRYAELEARLAGIEEQLADLAHEVEPAGGDAGLEERLARLREQVEDLRSVVDGPATSGSYPALVSLPASEVPREPTLPAEPSREPTPNVQPSREPTPNVQPSREPVRSGAQRAADLRNTDPAAGPPRRRAGSAPASRLAATAQGSGFWALLGPSPQDRVGFFLICGGAILVVYALLSGLRFG